MWNRTRTRPRPTATVRPKPNQPTRHTKTHAQKKGRSKKGKKGKGGKKKGVKLGGTVAVADPATAMRHLARVRCWGVSFFVYKYLYALRVCA